MPKTFLNVMFAIEIVFIVLPFLDRKAQLTNS